MEKLLYSRRDAATALGQSLRQLDYLIEQGHLKITRIGRRVMVHKKQIDKFADGDHPVL